MSVPPEALAYFSDVRPLAVTTCATGTMSFSSNHRHPQREKRMKRSFTRLFTAAILACALSAASVQAQQIPATPLIGKFQTARADKCFDAMDAASQQRVRALFTQ